MNKQQKKQFVRELAGAIAKTIEGDIESGKIPESWDGIELRWLFAERCAYPTSYDSKKRKREYKNTVLVNGL